MSGSDTVLLVDRSAMVREPLTAALRAEGYLTLAAGDGEEAYEVAAGCTASLIVMDLDLPGAGGVALLRRLRATRAYRSTPVVLLIDGHDLKAVQEAVSHGVRDYLIKARFSMADLLGLMRRYCPVSPPAPGAQEPATAAATRAPSRAEASAPPTSAPTRPPTPIQHKAIGDDEVLKSFKPLVCREDLDDAIDRSPGLPILDSSPRRLAALFDHDEGSLLDAVEVVKRDPALCYSLLVAANGEPYAGMHPAVNAHQAVTRMGVESLMRHVETCEAVPLPGGDHDAIDGAAFWRHAVAVATLSAELTREAQGKPDEIETAYTAGLIHDLGALAFVHRLSPAYAETFETAEGLGKPLADAEHHLLLETHASLLDKALRKFGVGPEVANPVGLHHHEPAASRHLAGDSFALLCRVRLADALTHAVCLGHPGDDTVGATDALVKTVGVEPSRLRDMVEALPDRLGVTEPLALPTDRGRPASEATGKRLESARPRYAGPDPEADPVALLVRSFEAPARAAGVWVVHVPNVRERGPVTDQVRAAELEEKLGKLPLLVVSPRGNIELDESFTVGRTVRTMSMPLDPKGVALAIEKLSRHDMQRAA